MRTTNFLLMIFMAHYSRVVSAFVLGSHLQHSALQPLAILRRCARGTQGTISMAAGLGKKGSLSKALKKTTGAVTVSLEYDPEATSTSSENDLIVLSMQLRKIKAASLWAPNLADVGILSKEQATAKGNFPGPCPLVYYPPLSSPDASTIEEARKAGASAVVIRPQLLHLADKVAELEMECVWDVRSVQELDLLLLSPKNGHHTYNFLIPGYDSEELVGRMPADALVVASVDRANDEIEIGRELGKKGVKALLVRQACRGDANVDLRYGRHAIESLTSKANPSFQITGMGMGKGDADARRSFGADATGRAMQDRASVQKDINHFHDKPGGTDFKKIADKGTTF